MGLCPSRRRVHVFKSGQIVPEPEPDPYGPASKLVVQDSSVTEQQSPGSVDDGEDLGDDDSGDDGSDSSTSGSDTGLAPEQLWLRQAERQKRQARRRRRQRKLAKAEGHQDVRTLDSLYTIGIRIGRGTYASVSACTRIKSGVECALKSIDKKKSSGEFQLAEEREIMKLVDHKNIVKLYDVFEDAKQLHIVMELCRGGELFDRLQSLTPQRFAEAEACMLVRQMASAIAYLHSRHIAHRDLKPENFMYLNAVDGPDVCLKLIDFGLSKRFVLGQIMKTLACTANYVAPEVLAGAYTHACDIWSLGVTIYVLLSGLPPFGAESEETTFKKIKTGVFSFDDNAWASVSASPKDLIRSMLTMDVGGRVVAEQVLEHKWLRHSRSGTWGWFNGLLSRHHRSRRRQ